METHSNAPQNEQHPDALRRLEETEEVIRAISGGEVDAFVVSTDNEPQVITLSTADRAYRLLTDRMVQGAVTVASDATILYANRPFADMLGVAIDALPGALLSRLVYEGDAPLLEAVLARARIESTGTEIIFKRDGGNFSARVEADTPFEDARVTCLVVTDLSEQRRHEAVIRAEALGRSILDQAVDAVVVCDPRGDVVRASNSAHLLCGCNPLLQPFGAVFPLAGHVEALDLQAVLRGEVMRSVAFEMPLPDRRVSLLVSAGPVIDAAGEAVACVVTMTDITDLKSAELELKAADTRKDEMLAVVVHELRNPLAHISLVVDLLHRGQAGTLDMEQVRTSLKRGIEHIARLVEDLTDFNRIRLGKLSLRLNDVDLRVIVSRAVESCEGSITARKQQLQVNVAQAPVPVSADETRLAQVFINLLNNANKFTDEGGTIAVALKVDAPRGEAVVTVRDNGKGIAPAMLRRIFNAFEQADPSERHGGLGVGLTLSRRIVELHGGTIDAASDGSGMGSAFTVRLPLRKMAP